MMSNARPRYWTLAGTVAGLVLLAGCTSTIDMIPTRAGGLPQNAPERPAVQPAFPAINDTAFRREDTPLTAEEQKKLESDLTGLRQTQINRANPPPPPPPAKTKQPRKEAPPAARNP
jgi:hypothetical protein